MSFNNIFSTGQLLKKSEIHERASEITVKRDLRDQLRELKEGRSYDYFLREILSVYLESRK